MPKRLCWECAGAVPSDWPECPHCGAPTGFQQQSSDVGDPLSSGTPTPTTKDGLADPPPSGPQVDDASIRASLKQYTAHRRLLCLECGYEGLMGIKSSTLPWYGTWWFILSLLAVTLVLRSFVDAYTRMRFGESGGDWVLAPAVCLGLLRIVGGFDRRQELVCPSCRQVLTVK